MEEITRLFFCANTSIAILPFTSEDVVTTGIASRSSARPFVNAFAPPRCPDKTEITNCPFSSNTITAGSVSLLFKHGAISRTTIPIAPINTSASSEEKCSFIHCLNGTGL